MNRRTNRVEFRLDEKEYSALMKNVRKAGLSREAYMRKLIRGAPVKELPPVDFFSVLKELRQINNNMNQIAVVANTKGFVDTAAYWENVEWLQKTVGEMMEVMYG